MQNAKLRVVEDVDPYEMVNEAQSVGEGFALLLRNAKFKIGTGCHPERSEWIFFDMER